MDAITFTPTSSRLARAAAVVAVVIVVCGQAAASGRARPASARVTRQVAHSLFGFERVRVRKGKLVRSTMTRGMKGIDAPPAEMLATLFGPGELHVETGGSVTWKGEGKVTRVGTIETIAGKKVFRPTRRIARMRNRVLGAKMAGAVEEIAAEGMRNVGHYGHWVARRVTELPGRDASRTRYSSMIYWPKGSSEIDGQGLQDRAAYRIQGTEEAVGAALQPADGVTEGGLAVRWSEPTAEGRARSRLVLYPRGKPASRSPAFEQLADMILQGVRPQGGGALLERETVAPGENPVRARTRRDTKQLSGYLVDQVKRWADLTSRESPAVARESAVAQQVWAVSGTRPKVTADLPPNLMLSVLLGPGKIRVSPEGPVSWISRDGAETELGRMTVRKAAGRGAAPGIPVFSVAPEIIERRDAHLGRPMLSEFLNDLTDTVGSLGLRKTPRFPRRFQYRSPEKVMASRVAPQGLAPSVRIPVSQTLLIGVGTDVFRQLGSLVPSSVGDALRSPRKGANTKLRWVADQLIVPGRERGQAVQAPRGMVVENQVQLIAGQGGGTWIRYRYRLVTPQARQRADRERARWRALKREGGPLLALEAAVAEGMWEIGRAGEGQVRPQVSAAMPANLMLEPLLGAGRLDVADGGAVSWLAEDGQTTHLGRIDVGGVAPRFKPSQALRDRRAEFVGGQILYRVLHDIDAQEYVTARDGSGYRRFEEKVLEEGAPWEPGESPRSLTVFRDRTVEIAESVHSRQGRVIDSAIEAMPEGLEGVVPVPAYGKATTIRWRSNSVMRGDGQRLSAPSGARIEHELTLSKENGRQWIRYQYRMIDTRPRPADGQPRRAQR